MATILDIGSRLELFVDTYLIDLLEGARLRLNTPHAEALTGEPPRGHYMTVIKDDDLYRAFYRGHVPGYLGEDPEGDPGAVTCYAESRDGREWSQPHLGLFEVNGARVNNVILANAASLSHNFTPFLDTRPGVAPDQRFKALAGTHAAGGLCALASGDGIRWKKMQEDPVIVSLSYAFDSQNVAFWSQVEGCYVCYYRSLGTVHGPLRTISRTTSRDFLTWTEGVSMAPNVPGEHLYTSGAHPYFRAPHIYIALPTRFFPERGDSTDIAFMTSRGGAQFDRLFMEAFIRPGPGAERWQGRANYAALNVVPTGETEMTVYHGPGGRRYVLRIDGFASVNAPYAGGTLITKPFTFEGDELILNYSTSAGGQIQVEIQTAEGQPVPGYSLAECRPIVGDEIAGVVAWRSASAVGGLAGRPIRLRFVMADADLYSLRFR